MTLEKECIKKMCSFCVSDWHIATTVLPYIKEKTEKDEKVISILEENIEKNIMGLVKRANIDKTTTNKIKNINWETKDWTKYEQFEYFMEENYSKNTNIIISGDKEYINKINNYVDKWLNKNNERIKKENSKINIVNCYNISNNKTEDVISKYKYILNTSGEKKISEYLNTNSYSIKRIKEKPDIIKFC